MFKEGLFFQGYEGDSASKCTILGSIPTNLVTARRVGPVAESKKDRQVPEWTPFAISTEHTVAQFLVDAGNGEFCHRESSRPRDDLLICWSAFPIATASPHRTLTHEDLVCSADVSTVPHCWAHQLSRDSRTHEPLLRPTARTYPVSLPRRTAAWPASSAGSRSA